MNKERIIDRIKKLFALGGNNPSEKEAQLALARAQELLLTNGMTAADLDVGEEDPEVKDNVSVEVGGQKVGWKIALALVIAKNFRCKVILNSVQRSFSWQRRRMQYSARIVGLGRDADACGEALRYIYLVAPKLWKKYWAEHRELTTNSASFCRESYFAGFVKGVTATFEENVESKALMVIVPNAVIERTKELISGQSRFRPPVEHAAGPALRGYQDGRQFARPHRYLEAT
jgi:hypothetical protein